MTDVCIVGGGIAGATAAILLGRAGLTVDLFDQQVFP
jgi:2-polyprenyl-6-methoxyphenol hydroxylase-like FAD-dependent oxidoreductase